MIIAGETSGDFHAANLVREARRLDPEVAFYGIGGERMRAEGVETLVDSRDMAVVGLVEVLAHFPRLYGVLRRMRRHLRQERPDLLILVDYPEFNLRLAKTARQLGIRVLFYISPQIWAWRQHRVHTVAQRVDMMAVVFPFEVPFYQRAGVPVRFVGHPLVDEVHCDLTRAAAVRAIGLDPARPVVGLLPGSRRSEVRRLLGPLLEAGALLRAGRPDAQFVLPLASGLEEADIAAWLDAERLPLTVVRGRPHEVMRACDAVAAASGTVTLELALLGTPLVVVYKVAPLTYHLMRRMIRIPHIALCNIVAGERIAAELLQDAATPEAIATELRRLLDHPAATRAQLARVRGLLGSGGGAENVARLALEMVRGGEIR